MQHTSNPGNHSELRSSQSNAQDHQHESVMKSTVGFHHDATTTNKYFKSYSRDLSSVKNVPADTTGTNEVVIKIKGINEQKSPNLAFPCVKPRRKKSADGLALSRSIIITPDVIESLRGLSLPFAARSIGLSITAFKSACRKLGVLRWDYTRGPGRERGGAEAHKYLRDKDKICPRTSCIVPVRLQAFHFCTWQGSQLSSDAESAQEMLASGADSNSCPSHLVDPGHKCDAEELQKILAPEEQAEGDNSDDGLVRWMLTQPWRRVG